MAFCEFGELLRDGFLLGELGVSIEVDLGILQVCLITVAIGDRLIELQLDTVSGRSPRADRLSSLADPGRKLILTSCPVIWLRMSTLLYAITVPTPRR